MNRLAQHVGMMACLALAGCAMSRGTTTSAAPQGSAETIAISVGPCFGFCPVYSVAVSPDGRISFTGDRHTAVLGNRTRDGGPAAYRAIAAPIAPYRPATGSSGKTACTQSISDQRTYEISWTSPDGTVTRLDHDGGCRSGANDALNAVLGDLPQTLGIAPWAQQTTRPGVSRG